MRYLDLSREVKLHFKKNTFKKDDEGKTVFDINIAEKAHIYSPFSLGDNKVLSGDFFDSIWSIAASTAPSTSFHFIFGCQDLKEDESICVTKAFVDSCLNRYKVNDIQHKRSTILSLILFLTSLIFLGIMAALSLNGVNAIIVELVDIAGWVFMWEAVNQFFIERSLLSIKKKRLIHLINSKVEYK